MTSNRIILDTVTEHLFQTKSLREGAKLRKLRDGYRTSPKTKTGFPGRSIRLRERGSS